MPGINEDRERQVVPRWRDFDTTCGRGELAALRSAGENRFSDGMLDNLEKEWRSRPGLSVASDFVSCALTLGRFTIAIDAAHSVLADRNAPTVAATLASTYLSESEEGASFEETARGMRSVMGRAP